MIVFVVTILCFVPAISGGFVSWDDGVNFVANPWYRGFGAAQLKWMWSTTLLGHYVPLAWMSLGFDYVMWGMDPSGYHITNVVLHALDAVLVFALAREITLRKPSGIARPNVVSLAAACAALLFAIHPLRVESVAWVTERRDVLSLAFALLAVLAYLRSSDNQSRLNRWYWISLACAACAVLSKATTVTLPAVLFVISVYPLRLIGGSAGWTSDSAKRTYARIAPFAVLSLIFGIASVIVLRAGAQLGAGAKIAVVGYGVVFYVWKTLVPIGLSPLYQMPETIDPLAPMFLACMAATVLLLVALVFARKRVPGLVAASAAFLIVMLPLLGVVQNGNQIVADRYTYHASPALAVAACGGIVWLLERFRRATLGALIATTFVLGVATWRQTEFWHDSVTLWSRALDMDSTNAIAHNDLGVEFASAGNSNAAIAQYRKAIALRPGYAQAHNNLGFEIAHLGAGSQAESEYRQAIAIDPKYAEAEINLGNLLLAGGRSAEAISHYERATIVDPKHAGAEYDLGIALMREKRLVQAAQHLERATELDPFDADARDALSSVRGQLVHN